MRHRLLVFLDANVLFSASRSERSDFHRFWQSSAWEILTSYYVVGEVRRHCASPHQTDRFDALLAKTRIVSDAPHLPLPPSVTLPAKDIPIYLAAMASGADYLITGDRAHFTPYFGRRIGGLTVMLPAAFLQTLSA